MMLDVAIEVAREPVDDSPPFDEILEELATRDRKYLLEELSSRGNSRALCAAECAREAGLEDPTPEEVVDEFEAAVDAKLESWGEVEIDETYSALYERYRDGVEAIEGGAA